MKVNLFSSSTEYVTLSMSLIWITGAYYFLFFFHAYVHGHGNIPSSDVHSDSNGTSEHSERMFTINSGRGVGASSSRTGERAR